MPVYDYRCKECSHEFSMKQSMRDEPVKDCPECDKGKVHRIIKKVSFQLKGTGFYSTRGDT